MANSYGPQSIVQDGLVFAADAANPISWASPSSTDVNDLINPAITGSTINDASPGPLDGGVGYWEFDGTDDYINFPDADVVLPDSPYTYITAECWANVATENNYTGIFQIGSPTLSIGIGVWTRSVGRLEWGIASSGGIIRPYISSYLATYPGWRLLTCTFDGTGAGGQMYVDGIARGVSYTSTGTFSTNDTYTMKIGSENTLDFHGKVGSLKLYNRVLTQAEITQNYNATKNRFQ